jgi:outer membrane protein
MNKGYQYLILCVCMLPAMWGNRLQAQAQRLSLEDVIRLAREQSPQYRLAATQKEISYYQYLTYRSDFNPQVSFNGNAPVYNKEYFGVRQPDGTIKFQAISQNYANLGFSLSQQIPLTGGELSLNTDITRFDDFKLKTKQYNGTPVYLRLAQPLFAFNAMSWRKKIEPLKYEESKREFVQQMENIAQQATALYFDVLDAQSDISIAISNLKNTEQNYEIEQKRVNLGTTTEDKLLQLELQVLNSRQHLEKANYAYQVAQLQLKSFIGSKDRTQVEAVVPDLVTPFIIDSAKAIEYARLYRPEFIAFERKKKEAQRDLSQARGDMQQVNLAASFGLNNVGNELSAIYAQPNDQQRFSIGFNIPILDWGRRKARYNTARALEKLTDFNNELNEVTIVQEITTLMKNFELLKRSITLSKKTDTVAQRRYVIAYNLYQVGKLTITDLNLAQAEKDNARRNYVAALRAYWNAYYLLRRLTMYDFENDKRLFRE